MNEPVQDYDGSLWAIQVIKAAALTLRREKKLSQDAQANELTTYIKEHKEQFDGAEIEISQQSWGKHTKEGSTSTPTDKRIMKAAWYWLAEMHTKVIKNQISILPKVNATNSVLAAIHEQISGNSIINTELLKRLNGDFVLYRRSFNADKKEVMVATIKFGSDEDDSAFSSLMVYPLLGKMPDDKVDGYIIPHSEGALLQGRFVNLRGPCIFAISNLKSDPSTGMYLHGEGVMLAAAFGERPSAYPFFILRALGNEKVGVFTYEELSKNEMLWDFLKPILDRGVVNWK